MIMTGNAAYFFYLANIKLKNLHKTAYIKPIPNAMVYADSSF